MKSHLSFSIIDCFTLSLKTVHFWQSKLRSLFTLNLDNTACKSIFKLRNTKQYFRNFTALIVLVAMLMSSPHSSNAQVAEITGSLTTGLVINEISDKLNGLIDNARRSGDFLAMRAAQEALLVIDAFEQANQRTLNLAFDRIGRERQAILNSLRQTALDIENGRIDTLAKLQESGDQLDRLVRDATFQKTPRLFRYRGTIINPDESSEVRVFVNGYRINQKIPALLINGQRFEAKVEGEDLRFILPRDLFQSDPGALLSEFGTLVLHRQSGGFLGIGAKWDEVRYDLNFIILPSQVGNIEVSYSFEKEQPRSETRELEEFRRKYGYGGWECHPIAFNPSVSKRRFDPARSSVLEGSGDSNGQLRNVQVRDVGVSFELCVRRPYTASGPGFRHAHVTLTEVWNELERLEQRSDAELGWLSNVAIPVEANAKELLITLKDFTGASRTTSASGGMLGRYANVVYDRDSNVVIVNPVLPVSINAL